MTDVTNRMNVRIILTVVVAFTSLYVYAGEKNLGNVGKSDASYFNRSSRPHVELVLSGNVKNISWRQRIRYTIHVDDETDGSSRYGEINSKEVFLNIRFVSEYEDISALEEQAENDIHTSHGLALIGKSTCFGCHSDEKNMTGPSFFDIANSYKKDTNRKEDLIKSVKEGSSGKWGEMVMPPTVNYNEDEISEIVDYILRQGSCTTCWVYPGTEGVFEVIEKPSQNGAQGAYIITASYTSSTGEQGLDTIVLPIQ